MSDRFTCLSLEKLLSWIKREEKTNKIFGIPRSLFFQPSESDIFRINQYGRVLETPVGVAAGPHTQLSQNIVSSWLTGARYIELKTIQVLDELEVTKPCINMEDEGYNCEWSQELKLEQSLNEYVNAFIAIYILKKRLLPGPLQSGRENNPGFIFNMSVGYNLEGILSPTVQKFLDSMANARIIIDEKLKIAKTIFPEAADLDIPSTISDNVTISTMHGCPPDEIEKIGRYFVEEKKLNTTIKLNPTLLGQVELRDILNNRLGFDTVVPDIAFEHDLKYDA
ncbi:MAG: putative selenate reductase subunit YgfK, partial [Proteobacteria bacterium]|nr:putative selenate reductase subunit YgfK [Pseudomonadota bacterium]